MQRFEHRRKQTVVFLERFQNRAGGQIQLGETAAVILHLLNELKRSFALRQDARRRPGRDAEPKRHLCLGSKRELAQAAQKFPVDVVGVGLQQHRKPMQVHA